MSTFKKVLSLVLCVSLLAGSFTFLGGLASATETETKTYGSPVIKSFAELDAQYDNFVYFATEVHEIEADAEGNVTKDNGVTDGKVKAGQWLEYRAHYRSDMWCAAVATGILYDTRFFDARMTSKPVVSTIPETTFRGYEVGTKTTENFNPDHPMTPRGGVSLGHTAKSCLDVNQYTAGYTALDEATYTNLADVWQTLTFDNSVHSLAFDYRTDTWFLKWYVKVLDNPTITETKTWSDPSTWKNKPHPTLAGQGDPRVNSNVATGAIIVGEYDDSTAALRGTCKNMNLAAQFKTNTLLLDDTVVNFKLEGEGFSASFEYEDGTAIGEAVKYQTGDAIVAPEAAAKAGFEFKGWAVKGTTEIVNDLKMGEADVTFVAIYEALPNQTATFIVDGEEYDTFEIYAGGKIVAPTAPEGTNGRTFIGWSTTEEGATVTDWTMPEGGATFYAVFTEAVTHSVVYYVNGEAYETVTVVEDTEFALIAAPELDEKLYRFIGWSTKADDATAIVTGAQAMGTEDIAYYAIIEEIVYYTVSYVVDGAAYGEATEYEENTTYTVIADEPAKTGYTFAGWSTVENDKTNILAGEQTITADVVFYAVYDINQYNVTFNANKGAFADGKDKITEAKDYASEIVAPAEAPARAGYKFLGWASKANATAAEELGTVSNKAVTFYAVWEANTYKATFYLDKDATEAIKVMDATYGKQLNFGSIAELAAMKPDSYFAGWADAETGEKVSQGSGSIIASYNFDSDKSFYALWTAYDSSITLMVRDYAAGEGWTEYKTTYNNAGTNYSIAGLKGKEIGSEMGWDIPVTITMGAPLCTTEEYDAANNINADIKYEGNKIYYLNTTASVNVTWDVNGETKTEKIDISYALDDPFVNSILVTNLNTTPATGYQFNGWVDENGNALTVVAGKGITIYAKNGGEQTITADYAKIDYTFVYNVNNVPGTSYSAKKTVEKTFNIGDTVLLEGLKVLDANGEETVLPTIGKENSEQTGGNLATGGYTGTNGYIFTGWTVGFDETAFNPADSFVITEDIIKAYSTGKSFEIKGVWEAQSYPLTFYYATGFDAEGAPIYEELVTYNLPTDASLTASRDAAEVLARSADKLPEGKTFNSWDDTTSTKMPAYGHKIYARYQSKSIAVYVDYNNGTADNPLTLQDTLKIQSFYNAYYGLDIMKEYPDGSAALYNQIRTMTITNTPGENYICIGWDAYYVEDGKDVYDTANWNKIDTTQDSYIATSTLVFKANWKAYGDFFIRLYDTNHKMVKALGKDFKMYYWASEIATDRENGDGVNHLPDNLVILIYIPTLEGFDFNGFFDINMWKNISLKVEPFAVDKSFFDPSNFAALFETLINFLLNELGISTGE